MQRDESLSFHCLPQLVVNPLVTRKPMEIEEVNAEVESRRMWFMFL